MKSIKKKSLFAFTLITAIVSTMMAVNLGLHASAPGDENLPYQIQKIINGTNMDGKGGLSKMWTDANSRGDTTGKTVVAETAAGLRSFSKYNINRVLWLNSNENNFSALGYTKVHGHSGVLLMNTNNESIYMSFHPLYPSPRVSGETRLKYLNSSASMNFLYGNGNLNNTVAGQAGNAFHIESLNIKDPETYERFLYFDVTHQNGLNILGQIAYYFNNPPTYTYPNCTCDDVAAKAMQSGNISIPVKGTPNDTLANAAILLKKTIKTIP